MQDSDGVKLGITVSLGFGFTGSLDTEANTARIFVIYDGHLRAIWALGVDSAELNKNTVDYCVRRLGLSGCPGEGLPSSLTKRLLSWRSRVRSRGRGSGTVPALTPR